MKTIFVLLIAFSFLAFGFFNVIRQIKITKALDEIVRFVSLVKTEMNYRKSEFLHIYSIGEKQGYKYLSFSDGQIFADEAVGAGIIEEFNSFIKNIGTTDQDGQISLCDEYKNRFEEALINRKSKDKEKLQVNTALSVFGALTVLIFFL